MHKIMIEIRNLGSKREKKGMNKSFLTSQNTSFSNSVTQERGYLGINRDSKMNIRQRVWIGSASLLMIILFSIVLVKGIDKHIENQDIMLCRSAQKSRNAEYLRKCECFYKTNDIICLQKGR